jgi:hypothetical protein
MSNTQTPTSHRYRRALAGLVATAAIGGLIAGCGSSSSTSASTTRTTSAASANAAPSGAPSGAKGAPAGFGAPATGAAAAKAKAAALARYPGTVERVMKLSDGSYEVHVIRKTGSEVHVLVSKSFGVTGTQTGPPGGTPPTTTTGGTNS